MILRSSTLVLVALVGMLTCHSLPSQRGAASAEPTQTPSLRVFAEIFRDFDFLGVRPITYKSVSSSKQTYPLADSDPLDARETPQPFPALLQAGQRYFLRNANLKGDLFYRELEKRFHDRHIETRIFMPHSVMAVVYDPPIPVRFVDNLSLVLQPVCLVFHGNGYEGLVIMDEALQVSTKRSSPQTNVHDYSLVIFKAPN
jgi:hypothetical protein